MQTRDTVRMTVRLPGPRAAIVAVCSYGNTSLFAARFIDGAGNPVPRVPLTARWQQFFRAAEGIASRAHEAHMETDSVGIARFCNLPTDTQVDILMTPSGARPALLHKLPARRERLSMLERIVVPQ